MDFIRFLGRNPATEWSDRIRAKTSSGFDKELGDVFRHSDAFMSRLFPSTELAMREAPEPAKDPGVLERLIELISGVLPRPRPEEFKSDAGERRDVFRELSLLPAEVSRVKALRAAWLATTAIVLESSGKVIEVGVSSEGLTVGLASTQATPQLTTREALRPSDVPAGGA